MSSLSADNLSKVQFLFSITTLFRRIFMKISSNNPTSAHYVRYDPKNEQTPSKIVSFSTRNSSVTEILVANTPSSPPSLLVTLCHVPPVCRPFQPSILSRPAHPYCLLFSVFGFPHYISVFLICSITHPNITKTIVHTQRQFCGEK